MSEARLRDALRRLRAADSPSPSFDSVMTPRRRRGQLRVGRAAVVAAGLLGAVFVLLHARPDQPPRLANLALPPTTDWLLETPKPDWLTQVTKKERSDGT